MFRQRIDVNTSDSIHVLVDLGVLVDLHVPYFGQMHNFSNIVFGFAGGTSFSKQ